MVIELAAAIRYVFFANKIYSSPIFLLYFYIIQLLHRLSPTEFDIKNNLEIPEVKSEFKQLYEYGMQLIQRGLIGVDDCKQIVKNRLIDRTGLSPEEFDKWLGY